LGSSDKIAWTQTATGLVATLPPQKVSDYTAALKITGQDLKPVAIAEVAEPVRSDAKGNFKLNADDAELHGSQINTESQGGQPNIGFWDRADEWASWKVQFTTPGAFQVLALCATTHDRSEFVIEAAGRELTANAVKTGGWDSFRPVEAGRIEIQQAGEQVVKIRPRDANTWKAMNLRAITLTKID
jgi:alpha-L-fucosidase